MVACFYEDHISLKLATETDQNTMLKRIFREKAGLPSGVNSEKFPNKCVINLIKLRQPFDLTGKAMFSNKILSTMTVASFVFDNGQTNYW